MNNHDSPLNRTERRRRTKLHAAMGLMPLRVGGDTAESALREGERECAEILTDLVAVLYDRSIGGVTLALTTALGRVVACPAGEPASVALGLRAVEAMLRAAADQAANQYRAARQ